MAVFEMCKSGETKIMFKTQSTNLGDYRPAGLLSLSSVLHIMDGVCLRVQS